MFIFTPRHYHNISANPHGRRICPTVWRGPLYSTCGMSTVLLVGHRFRDLLYCSVIVTLLLFLANMKLLFVPFTIQLVP